MSEMEKYMNEALKEIEFTGPIGSGKGMRFKIDENPTAINKSCCNSLKESSKIPSLDELCNNGVIKKHQLKELREAFKNNLNIIIVGDIGSGKTTLLKSLLTDEVANELIFVSVEHFANENAPREEQIASHSKDYILLKNTSGEIVRTVFSNINEQCLDTFFERLKEKKSVIGVGYRGTEFNDMLVNYDSNNRERYMFLEVYITNIGGNRKIILSKRLI